MDTWNNKADETLVALYAKGENQAFNVLLNRYKDKLYTYIYYIVLQLRDDRRHFSRNIYEGNYHNSPRTL